MLQVEKRKEVEQEIRIQVRELAQGLPAALRTSPTLGSSPQGPRPAPLHTTFCVIPTPPSSISVPFLLWVSLVPLSLCPSTLQELLPCGRRVYLGRIRSCDLSNMAFPPPEVGAVIVPM